LPGLGLPDAKRDWTLEGRSKNSRAAPRTRDCPKCYLVFTPRKKCPGCGYEFTAEQNRQAGTLITVDEELRKVEGGWLETAPLKEVMRAATTWAQIDAIRKARGYHPGWTKIQYDYRKERERQIDRGQG